MGEPPLTFARHGDVVKLWRGRQYLGPITKDRAAALIEALAQAMQADPLDEDDPQLPLG